MGGWREKKLGEISKVSKGKGISKSDIVDNGAVKCIRYGELFTHYGETISNVFSSTKVPTSKLVLSRKNDVVVPASHLPVDGDNTLDIALVSCICVDGVALGGDINIIRSQQNGIFLAYCLSNKKIDITRLTQRTTISHLYPSHLKLLKLEIPTLKEQQKIADCLTSIDDLITAQTQKVETLKAHKKGLMQQLFPNTDKKQTQEPAT